jgi:hypothetical protein
MTATLEKPFDPPKPSAGFQAGPTLLTLLDAPQPVIMTATNPRTARITGTSSFGDNTFGYGPFGGVVETVPHGSFDPPTPLL